MRLLADYHTHTTYSGDGKGTMEENVKAAIEKGLKVLAISDHGPGHMGYGIAYKKYPEMREALDRLQEKYPQIRLLLGIEANVMNEQGQLDVDEAFLKYNDILLAGYHFGSSPKAHVRDVKMHWYNLMSKKSAYYFEKAKEYNTKAFIRALEQYPIHILTHPGAKGPADLEAVAKVAAKRNTAMEINNSHGHLTYEEVVLVSGTGCMFAINSDAHRPEHIGRFENGIDRALRAGIDESRILNAREDLIYFGKPSV